MGRVRTRYSEVQIQSSENPEARYEGEDFGYHSQYHYAPNPQDVQNDRDNRKASTSSAQQYKPTALRWPFLIILLLALLTTLAFLSYAITTLPVVGMNDKAKNIETRGLSAVEVKDHTQSVIIDLVLATELPVQTKASGDRVNIEKQTVEVERSTLYKRSADLGDIETTGTVTVSESTSETPIIHSISESSSETPIIHSSKPPGDFGDIGTVTVSESSSETPVGTKPPGDFGSIGTVTVSEEPGSAPETPIPTQDQGDFGEIGQKTVTEVGAVPTPTNVAHTPGAPGSDDTGVTTFTDEMGSVITSTDTPPPITSLQTSTLTNSKGDVTGTQVATVLVKPSVTVETDSAGNPTATVATYPVPPTVRTAVYSIDAAHYFMGTFLTTLIASILAIAVRILDTNVKSFQPWHALTHEQGTSGRDSLCLDTGGWRSLLMGLRSLAGGHAVVFLASVLSLSSALLVPVSAGAILLDLRGDGCKLGGSSASNCAYVLSVSPTVSRATIGILAVMILATILLVIIVGRWQLGVYTNPWSMSTLASLSVNPNTRRMILDAATGPDTKRASSELRHQDFKLDNFRGAKGQMEYGIVALDRFGGTGLSPHQNESSALTSRVEDEKFLGRKHSSPFFMLGIVGRVCLFLFVSGVLILVLYYARTGGDTPFERFMDSDTFAVQFLFTGLGIVITLLWSGFFGAVSVMNTYQYLSESPREAAQSVLLAPPTNAFSGLWHSIRTRRIFLGLVSLTSIFSESLGLFLGNVRFQVTQTYFVNQLCTWAAVGIMSLMLLLLLVSWFLKWPHMPVDPSSIAGAMYYVCDDSVADRFEGLSTVNKKDRDRTVTGMGLLYEFSESVGAKGETRVGLNVLETQVFMS
ncbi:hypothetical protein F4808DRAFT_448795 [Astrocystis sublimbata]|nr:hypothetical protein F4808DRAFT_448795 [Astrocystis sublimbata]